MLHVFLTRERVIPLHLGCASDVTDTEVDEMEEHLRGLGYLEYFQYSPKRSSI